MCTIIDGLLAGADIKEQSELDFVNAYSSDYLKNLTDGIASTHKPIIAAINGYAVRPCFPDLTVPRHFVPSDRLGTER